MSETVPTMALQMATDAQMVLFGQLGAQHQYVREQAEAPSSGMLERGLEFDATMLALLILDRFLSDDLVPWPQRRPDAYVPSLQLLRVQGEAHVLLAEGSRLVLSVNELEPRVYPHADASEQVKARWRMM